LRVRLSGVVRRNVNTQIVVRARDRRHWHAIARLKDHQILRQCRRRGAGVDHAIAGVAAPHNLKLDLIA
jgi:hypothetical protein